jgi:hypothetical protein
MIMPMILVSLPILFHTQDLLSHFIRLPTSVSLSCAPNPDPISALDRRRQILLPKRRQTRTRRIRVRLEPRQIRMGVLQERGRPLMRQERWLADRLDGYEMGVGWVEGEGVGGG